MMWEAKQHRRVGVCSQGAKKVAVKPCSGVQSHQIVGGEKESWKLQSARESPDVGKYGR